ncbi:hypothetical protein [Thiocapsa marina]|uniref:Uncharacterized protein n=1 Tax=Thiocapsa marina 5811 TaxID=768671 RepID=F9U9S3_9GAMM|nr:hypothetical protein [Thiocapsa marina]EGV18871.1 hypothetical protein ThimaDRAFT_1675 [Thiocapsa marina 5811]
MTPSVRILTLVYETPPAEALPPDHPWQRFDALGRTLRRHLPGATAAVFARPEIALDGSGTVTWTSALAGQPRPLLDLPDEAQAAARRVLADHLNAISHLAEELARREPDDPEPAQLLKRAIVYPGDEAVYVIGGAPVLISWGGTDPGRPPRGAGAPDPATVPAPRRRPAWILPVLGLIALATLGLGLGLGVWLWQLQETEQGLREDLAVALANHCDPVAPLVELASRLDRIDREDARYADIRMAVLTEIGICEEAALFTERLATEPPCDHLPALNAELGFYDLEREPFRALKTDLDRRISACTRVDGLAQRLDAVAGDCLAVVALEREIATLDEPTRELTVLRLGLDRAIAACRLAETLDPRLAEASEDCTALRTLARETASAFVELDAGRLPLSAIRDALQDALARCDLADHLEGELARSQDDCLALAGLDETLSRHNREREPLAAVAERLAVALRQCADLNDLEQRFAEANGDCDRLQALADGLEGYRNNLRFLDIRTRLTPELQVCSEADALEEQIAAIGGDCTKARALAARLVDQGDPRFVKARKSLEAPIADCDRIDRYTRRLAEAGADCTRLVALERDLKRESAMTLQPIRQALGERIGPCRPPPPKPVVVQAPPKATPPEIKIGTKPTTPPPPPQGSGSFAMRGDCTGRLTIDPTSGWDGDRVRHIVTIDPPASERVARVTSTNPGCRNCALRKIGRNTWRGDLFYGCSGRGIVQVSYAAYDASGRMICSGNGSDLCLGRRRR